MTETNINSFHLTYNARHLKPEDVAKNFIFNDDLEELIQDNHTVLLGARGCGKTTLMKMVTLPALYSWQEKYSKEIREKIAFYSVYISTDIYWNAQKDSYNKQLSNFPKYSEVVSKVAVTTNVLYALCETFENIIKYELNILDEEKEVELSKSLIKEWALPPTIPRLSMIKESLLRRTDLLNRHIQRTVFNYNKDSEVKADEDYFFLDFHSAVQMAISVFERTVLINGKGKWALCFDELELAPDWLQERLFQSLRSRTQNILYKLSASPIVPKFKEMLATPGNDLKLIKMWPHGKNDDYLKFSETLVKSLLIKKYGVPIDPEVIFGSNPLFSKESDKNDYNEGGETWQEIKDLAINDSELRDLLKKNKIDPNNPVAIDKRKLDTVLRKIKPIVYFRNYYGPYQERLGKKKARSRKASTLFYGKEVIYKICDGNPRWLIGIINEMLSKNSNKKVSKIKEVDQASVLEHIAEQFSNVIKTIPEAVIEINNKVYSLSGILKEIGDSFYKEIVLGKFQKDPHSTFFIDKNIDDEFIRILEKGVYQGAIIFVNPSENAFDFEMKNKRFRLSYLFSPLFKIPLRKYSVVALSKCLSGKETITKQTEIDFN